MIRIGSLVRFRPELVEKKHRIAITGGLFGPPTEVSENSTFMVEDMHNQGNEDEPDYEVQLSGFPWLVYEDELLEAIPQTNLQGG